MAYRPNYRWILGLSALGALAFCVVFLYFWEINFNSDYALVGLFAKKVLQGRQSPLFLFNVNYMGMLLEGGTVALAFRIFGIHPWSLNIGNTLFFVLLLVATYFAVRELAPDPDSRSAKATAAFSCLFLSMGSPVFGEYVLRTQPNYTETFLFGTLLIFLYARLLRVIYFESTPASHPIRLAFLSGLTFGFGFYVYAQILYFALAIGLHFALICLREQRTLTRVSLRGALIPVRIGTPAWSSWLLKPLHFLNGVHALLAWVCFFSPESSRPRLPFGIGQNPMTSLVLSAKIYLLIQVLAIGITQRKRLRPRVALALSGLLGFMIGISPKVYGEIKLHVPFSARTGMDGDWTAVRNRIGIVAHAFAAYFNLDSLPMPLAAPVLLITIGVLAVFLYRSGKAALEFLDPGSPRESLHRASVYAMLGLAVLIGFLVSNNSTDTTRIRYLSALVLVQAAAFGTVLANSRASRRRTLSQITAVAIGVSLLSSSAFALYKTAHDVIRPYPQMQIIAWLASKDLHFGIADYWYAYSITFLTDEAVILDPLRDGYIPDYAPIVAREPRIAYLDTTPPAGPSIRLRGIEYRVHETRQFTGPKPFPYDPHSSQTVYASVLERRP